MSLPTRIVIYVALLVCAAFFGSRFFRGSTQVNVRLADELEEKQPAITASSNIVSNSNAPALTNLTATATGATATATSAPVATATGETNPPASITRPPKPADRSVMSRMLGSGGLFVLAMIAFCLMLARDISHYVASRTEKFLYVDEGIKSPEYEQAEQIWVDGNFLEAIQRMREILKSKPREQYIALRIAEIYEKDLQNFLAAALEYEEVLKQKIEPERWGWAAIHLCNLYSKMNQEAKTIALLKRIVAEYGQTTAAKKARERLEQIEPPTVEEAKEDQPASNLPPGFSPRKS